MGFEALMAATEFSDPALAPKPSPQIQPAAMLPSLPVIEADRKCNSTELSCMVCLTSIFRAACLCFQGSFYQPRALVSVPINESSNLCVVVKPGRSSSDTSSASDDCPLILEEPLTSPADEQRRIWRSWSMYVTSSSPLLNFSASPKSPSQLSLSVIGSPCLEDEKISPSASESPQHTWTRPHREDSRRSHV